MRKRLTTGVSILSRRNFLGASAGLLAVSGFGVTSHAKDAPKTLRIGYQKYGTLVMLKAQRRLEEHFAPLGTEVTWTEFAGGVKVMEALNVGSIDFGVTGDGPAIIAQAASAPFVYVGFEPPTPEGVAILVKNDSPIQSMADLKGKRIATSRGGNAHHLALRSLAKVGVKYTEVEWLYLFPADARVAFERGNIDAWGLWDPFLAGVQVDLKPRVLADGRFANVSNHQFYVASRDLAEKSPLTLKTLLSEIDRVDGESKADPVAVAKVLAPTIGMQPDAVERALRRMGYGVKAPTEEVIASQQAVADLFLSAGLIPKAVKVSEAVLTRS